MKRFMLILKHQIEKIYPAERLFHWTGLTPLGETKSGHIKANNRAAAKQALRAQTVIIKSISSRFHWATPLRQHDITLMLQQLARIMQTRITLIQALHILLSCQTHPTLWHILSQIQRDLASGASFTEALQHHPRWFDPLVCALVHLGERTCILSQIMEQIVMHRNKHHKLKQQFKTILMYPCTVIVLAGIVTAYLLLTVVPQLQTFFQHAHQPLPWSTALLIGFAAWIKTYGSYLSCIIVASILYLKNAYQHTIALRRRIDKWVLVIPKTGILCQSLYLARAFQALAMTQQASLPLPDGLQWVALITGNFCYKQAFLHMQRAVQQGDSLRSAILQTKVFPELVVQILSLGEESGTLPILLNDLSHYYTQTVEDSIQQLSGCIEPALMIVLGLIVGGLILCMYLPMIQLGSLS